MKTIYKKLLFVLALILIIGCINYKETITYISSKYKSITEQKEYTVKVKTESQTLSIPLEEYLVGVVAGEMPVSFELEAIKAQVVAARTFVLSRNLKVDNTTASQVYLTDNQMKKNWGSHYQENKRKVEKAVKETSYEVMTYEGKYISALFFSSSNGKTVNCGDYFNGEVVYLKAVDSKWDLTIDPTNKRKKTFTKQQLANAFDVKNPDMSITSYTSSGYVNKVIINDKTYTGREVREKLGLASSCFSIELTNKGYVFETSGSGHGVGMSQYGAQGMAKEKKTYKEILNHYYQNIKIERID
ncbi:MAG: stage II sporulation protein D [Coprobacillus sp.]